MMVIGEGCFGAGGPCIPSCLVETDEDDGSTWVTFYETVMKNDSYLGHACLVLPGTLLEEGAAAADFCTTPPHFRVKKETAVIGAAADLRTVAHRSEKETSVPAAAATRAAPAAAHDGYAPLDGILPSADPELGLQGAAAAAATSRSGHGCGSCCAALDRVAERWCFVSSKTLRPFLFHNAVFAMVNYGICFDLCFVAASLCASFVKCLVFCRLVCAPVHALRARSSILHPDLIDAASSSHDSPSLAPSLSRSLVAQLPSDSPSSSSG